MSGKKKNAHPPTPLTSQASSPSDAPPPFPPHATRRRRGDDDGGASPPSGGDPATRRRVKRPERGLAPAPSSALGALSALDDDTLDGAAGSHIDSVVKIYATHAEPNFSLPWQRKRPIASSSSGVVIEGPSPRSPCRLITNAHSVEFATLVKVRRRGDDRKFVATVLAVGPECDLALLAVADPAFWTGLRPVSFGALAPRFQSGCGIFGFPMGGDGLCATRGIVSRVEVCSYVHASAELLSAQTDSAINSGASGGAAFDISGKCE